MNSVIPCRSRLVFWKRWIYHGVNIPSTTVFDHVSVPIQQEEESIRAQAGPGHGLLQRLISCTYNFIGIKKIRELKLLHAQAAQILSLVCEDAKINQVVLYAEALLLAAKEGNVEFVLQVSKANAEIVLIGENSFHNIFCHAVKHRQARVFDLIYGLRFKDVVATSRDRDGNTLLHIAATLAPDSVLHPIYGPMLLQMQRELQWFKEVESLIPPTMRGLQNKDGMTAEELFRESHKDLMKQAEKWIKSTASSCSVVGSLIVTVVFAAAFTVPGGNDQNHGYPLFRNQPFFKVFIFSTILSLLSSSTSVLMFLAVLTSRYSQEKLLQSLPTKLIIGLSFLFISFVSMIIAFLSTISLMLKHTNFSLGLLPSFVLAMFPFSSLCCHNSLFFFILLFLLMGVSSIGK